MTSSAIGITRSRHGGFWTGWIAFASTMLIIIGFFQVIAGLTGIFKDDFYVVDKHDLVITIDYTAWGWAHLIIGLLAIGVAIGIIVGQLWARIMGVFIAVISALANITFLNAAPVWSTILIAFDVLVIWALTVHGGEVKQSMTDVAY